MKCGHDLLGYAETDLQAFNDTVFVRHRPGMYVGSTDAFGLHHMLFELVNDSLSSSTGEVPSSLHLALSADGIVTLSDNRVPPADVEASFSQFPSVHSNFSHPIANALSEELTARARTPGAVTQCTFRRGQLHAAMQFGGPPDDRGLTVRFRPDPDIFGSTRFDPGTIRDRLRRCAFLNGGVRITFTDEMSSTEDAFEYAHGVAEYVKWLNADRTPIHPEVITFDGIADGVEYEVGLQWCEEEELMLSFANGYHTRNGGTHANGLRAAVRDVVRNLSLASFSSEKVTPDDTRAGLTAVVSVRLDVPYYTGATRDQLGNPEVERALAVALTPELIEHLEGHPEVAKAITHRTLTEREGRERARKAREAVRTAKKRK